MRRSLLIVFCVCGCVTVPVERKRRTVTYYQVTGVASPVLLEVGGVGRVRLRGVTAVGGTPLRPGEVWRRAKAYVERAVLGKMVRMEPAPWGPVPRGDYHGADVWVPVGGGREILLAAELLRRGYARLAGDWRRSGRAELLRAMEAEARAARRGLWAE